MVCAARLLWAALLLWAASGCSSEVIGPPGAIDVEPGVWSWVPITSTRCGDGSETGLGINPSKDSDTLLIYLNGGGACWDHQTCVVDEAATYVTKGFGPLAFDVYRPALATGPFDRSDVANPLRDAHLAWLPYCTGDFHAGTRSLTYDGVEVDHVGYHNVGLFLERLKFSYPSVERVVLAGTSAGGYGALFNWDRTEQVFEQARVYVIDDAGPLLPSPYLSPALHDTFETSWRLSAALPEGCDGCTTNLSQLHALLAQRHPETRAALLGFAKDKIIASYLDIDDAKYAEGAQALRGQLDPLPRVNYFVDGAEGHALLPAHWTDSTANGVILRDWVTQMLSDDPQWQSLAP